MNNNNITSIDDNIHPASIIYKKYNTNDQHIHPASMIKMTAAEKYIDNKNYYMDIIKYLSYNGAIKSSIT